MSSVFLSNVDDYLAPSQACVNPMFAESTNETPQQTKDDNAYSEREAVVIPRKRRVRRRPNGKNISNNAASMIPQTPVTSTPAKVSMADCLACSGCLTTAETVLVEQHSLDRLREWVMQSLENEKPRVVFTVSPASWADLLRILLGGGAVNTPMEEQESEVNHMLQRQLAWFLYQHCGACIVLDGSLPLQWSLHEAALEFCRSYRETKNSNTGTHRTSTPAPSLAISSTRFQQMDGTITTHSDATAHTTKSAHYPLVTSSCPALVCLVEKSCPAAVPHLQSTTSPMASVGAYLHQQNTQPSQRWRHVAIMPCHDKKLEASRKDFWDEGTNHPYVDLVLTTQDWWTLLQETLQTSTVQDTRRALQALPLAPISCKLDQAIHNVTHPTSTIPVSLVLPPTTTTTSSGNNDDDVVMEDVESSSSTMQSNDFFAFSSGGYADYVFRYASRALFGCVLRTVPWAPVISSERSRVKSARVARARQQRRDFFQVTLYRHLNGAYSCHSSDGAVPVLKFATAYGLQTIQRILQPFSSPANQDFPFDYVEAMACPSGCLNGGGQVRATSPGAEAPRETPTETRQRVQETQHVLQEIQTPLPVQEEGPPPQAWMHTHYHVVPPMQHTLGAAAGVAVQDTQW